MRLAALILLAALRVAHADDDANGTPSAVAIRTTDASAAKKWLAAGSIAAFHGAYLTWQYFAWYRKGSEDFHFEGDGPSTFSPSAFAGGVDKLGHTWGNYVMTRGTTAVLVAGGWPRVPSSLVAFGLTEVAYLLIEIQDGMAPYGFGKTDLAANLIGGGLAVLLDNVPAVDRLFDFRLEYWPSRQYRRQLRDGNVDGAQDYTGQSYLVALHLGALPGLASRDWGYWSRFIDVAVGFEAKHYYPGPADFAPRQTLYAGLAVNMQGVLSALLPDSKGRRIGRGLFEAYSLPYTTLRYVEASRSPQP